MKKGKFLIIFVLTAILVSVYGLACNQPYSLQSGAYGFQAAVITNKRTKEILERNFDDIFNSQEDFDKWGNLFSFQAFIDEKTEYFRKDNRCFVLNEGLAFEVVGVNMLRLHLPAWFGYDSDFYDVVIVLEWQQVYA